MSGAESNGRHLVMIYSLQGGGAERTLVNLLNRLGADAEKIVLLMGVAGGVLEREVPGGVECRYLFRNVFLARVCFWLYRKQIFRKPLELVWRWKVRERFDSIVCFLDCFMTDLVAASEQTDRKVTVVHANYESDPDFGLASLSPARREALIERRYRPLDRIAFVSRSARQGFINTIGELSNFEVLPILFSPDAIRQLSRERASLETKKPAMPEAFQFICVGRLLPVKGHDLLLDACGILKKEGVRFHLHLVGDGPSREALEQRVQSKGLASDVTFHGFQKNPYPYIAMADAMILPSVSEAMPTVICEAFVLGVPVLGSDCQGCRDILNDGQYGVVFERDQQVLAEEMKRFLDSAACVAQWRERGRAWLAEYNETEVLDRYRSLMGFGPLVQSAGDEK